MFILGALLALAFLALLFPAHITTIGYLSLRQLGFVVRWVKTKLQSLKTDSPEAASK